MYLHLHPKCMISNNTNYFMKKIHIFSTRKWKCVRFPRKSKSLFCLLSSFKVCTYYNHSTKLAMFVLQTPQPLYKIYRELYEHHHRKEYSLYLYFVLNFTGLILTNGYCDNMVSLRGVNKFVGFNVCNMYVCMHVYVCGLRFTSTAIANAAASS